MAKLVCNLEKIAMRAPAAASKALLQTAQDIVDLIKQITPVDTGNLRDSYGAEPVSSSVVRVGTAVTYAPFVEFGTVHMAAQPHLTPAFLQSEETFKVSMEQAIKEII